MSRLSAARAALPAGLQWHDSIPVVGQGWRAEAGRATIEPLEVWYVSPDSPLVPILTSGPRPWSRGKVTAGSSAQAGRDLDAVYGSVLTCRVLAARRRFRGCSEVQARIVVGGAGAVLACKGQKSAPTWTALVSLARHTAQLGIASGVVYVAIRAGATGWAPACPAARAGAAEMLAGRRLPTDAEIDDAVLNPQDATWAVALSECRRAVAWAEDLAWASQGEGSPGEGTAD